MTTTGFNVKRFARSKGVITSPSAIWIVMESAAGSGANHGQSKTRMPAIRKMPMPISGPRKKRAPEKVPIWEATPRSLYRKKLKPT